MEINTGMYWSCFFISRSKLPCVFIFNEVTWFFSSNVYLRESMNRAISYTRWWDGHGWMSFVHVFHKAALYIFVFPLYSWLDIRKKRRIFIQHSPFTGYFFSLFLLGFFPSMSQYFCSSDIVRINSW
jgi:hypothetical protein